MKKIYLLLLTLVTAGTSIQLDASKGGAFAGGLFTGAVIGSAASRGRGDRGWREYAQSLEDENAELRDEVRALNRELRNKR